MPVWIVPTIATLIFSVVWIFGDRRGALIFGIAFLVTWVPTTIHAILP